MSVVIRNARIIRAGKVLRANILVDQGKIRALTSGKLLHAARNIDAQGKFVLPGLVDAHAHLYDPAHADREDFTNGTIAAAAGGVTTVIEMVLSTPVDTPKRVTAKIEEGRRNSLIDFSLHAGMMNLANLHNIRAISNLGVRSFKTFTCKPYYANDHTLMYLMRETAMHKSILNVHAEDEATGNTNYHKLHASGRKDPMAHAMWKPNVAEELAVEKIVGFASAIRARLHISHLSTGEAVKIVRKAKRRGVKVTAETCPHYLSFTRDDMKKQGPYLKMNPCLKGRRDEAALWKGLRDGAVDMVTSEHAPGTREEKEAGWSDIWRAWGGVTSIETMLPVLLSEGVRRRKITLAGLQKACCENPARIFGLYPRKGTIQKGADADLVIVDMKKKRKVKAGDLHYKVGWTPYEGWSLTGWPVLTVLRGQVIFENGEIVSEPGYAEFLPMSPRHS